MADSADDQARTTPTSTDVVIVGGGHNGLVAAAYLARYGSKVTVLERLGRGGGERASLSRRGREPVALLVPGLAVALRDRSRPRAGRRTAFTPGRVVHAGAARGEAGRAVGRTAARRADRRLVSTADRFGPRVAGLAGVLRPDRARCPRVRAVAAGTAGAQGRDDEGGARGRRQLVLGPIP